MHQGACCLLCEETDAHWRKQGLSFSPGGRLLEDFGYLLKQLNLQPNCPFLFHNFCLFEEPEHLALKLFTKGMLELRLLLSSHSYLFFLKSILFVSHFSPSSFSPTIQSFPVVPLIFCSWQDFYS